MHHEELQFKKHKSKCILNAHRTSHSILQTHFNSSNYYLNFQTQTFYPKDADLGSDHCLANQFLSNKNTQDDQIISNYHVCQF